MKGWLLKGDLNVCVCVVLTISCEVLGRKYASGMKELSPVIPVNSRKLYCNQSCHCNTEICVLNCREQGIEIVYLQIMRVASDVL